MQNFHVFERSTDIIFDFQRKPGVSFTVGYRKALRGGTRGSRPLIVGKNDLQNESRGLLKEITSEQTSRI